MELLILIGMIAVVIFELVELRSRNSMRSKYRAYSPVGQMNKPKLNVKQVDSSKITLSDEQSKILNLLETTNDNYYITGKAGTGKSVLLQYFVEHCSKRVVVVAPTGVAALNVGGQTIHSFFRMPFDIELRELKVDYKLRELLRNIDTVVVDEVSMVRVDLMEGISKKTTNCQAEQRTVWRYTNGIIWGFVSITPCCRGW